jgi:hypothetical protein
MKSARILHEAVVTITSKKKKCNKIKWRIRFVYMEAKMIVLFFASNSW